MSQPARVVSSPAVTSRPAASFEAAMAEPVARRRRSVFPRHPAALFGLAILALVVFAAIFAPVLAPFDPNVQDVTLRLRPPLQPGSPYLLGTDQVGRDVLSRIIYGTRIALIVGLTAVAISGAIGIALGLVSGFYGGIVDDLIGWIANVELAFPFILLAIAVVAAIGPGLVNLIIVLSIVAWVVYARIVRAEVLAVRDLEYVQAARVIGVGDVRLLVRHILPNVLTPVIVIATFEVARMIIAEASLSFLSLGVEPSIPSWGSMLADGRQYLATAWWIATFPGLGIMLTVLAINLVGDWLRDMLDPRLRT
ncbi:MAG: ABC transporter permease [Chloroflexi bacterium]|nr:ABC transporter permease [Chloroflexota bacterium]